MALELEEKIMQEIGLGMNYNWFNGSGSCQYIRRDAAHKLEAAIREHYDAGEEIAEPDYRLITLARQAAEWDESQYELTKAWEVMSYVIAAHIHAVHDLAAIDDTLKYIREHYRPAQKRNQRYSMFEEPIFQWGKDKKRKF